MMDKISTSFCDLVTSILPRMNDLITDPLNHHGVPDPADVTDHSVFHPGMPKANL